MYFGNATHKKGEITLQLDQDDCNLLATACDFGALFLENGAEREKDPALARRLHTMSALFSVAHWGLTVQQESEGDK